MTTITGEEEDIFQVSLTSVYKTMKFRELYNLMEDHPESHSLITSEAKCFSKTTAEIWLELGDYLLESGEEVEQNAKKAYIQRKKDRANEISCSKTVFDEKLGINGEPDMVKNHKKEAEEKRKQPMFKEMLESIRGGILNENYVVDPQVVPIVFEDTCYRTQHAKQDVIKVEETNKMEKVEDEGKPETPLVILCHGLQGCHEDMLLMKLFLSFYCPKAIIISTESYERDTGIEIYLMARKLSEEIKQAIELHSKKNKITSISIIGFSVGIGC